MLEKQNAILKMHFELPKQMHRVGPPIPDIDKSEFPERKLIPTVNLPTEQTEITELETKMEIVKVKVI